MRLTPYAKSVDPRSRVGSGGVVAAIRDDIIAGRYHLHQRLPSERALAETYEVARGTVREALRQLESIGWVERRPGSGTYVAQPDFPDVAPIVDATSPMELMDTRRAMEPEIGRLAAFRATGRDLERLETLLRQLEGFETDRDGFSEADEAFHLALVDCTKNAMLIWVYKRISAVRNNEHWRASRLQTLTPTVIRQYNQQHRAIFNAIHSRSPDQAAKAIIAHLGFARGTLSGS